MNQTPVVQVGQPVATMPLPVYVYVPAQYQGMPPPPGPPCLDLLPWDAKAKKEAEAKQKQAIVAQQRAQDIAETKKKTGFLNQLTAIAKDVAYSAESAVTSGVTSTVNAVTNQMDKNTTQRFHTQFPQYGPNEKLLHGSSGKVISGGVPISGDLYISEHYLSFKGEYQDRKSIPGQTVHHPIVASVLLQTIMCIQPAIAVFGTDKTAAPTLKPVPDQKTLPTALMIFTNDYRLHLFYNFTDYAEIFNILDHMWRAAVNTNMIGVPTMQVPMASAPVMQMGQPVQMGQPIMTAPPAAPHMTGSGIRHIDFFVLLTHLLIPVSPSAPPIDDGRSVMYPTLNH